jgi:hypothetical protein
MPMPPAENQSETSLVALQAEVRSLRTLFNIVLGALLLLVVSLFSFILRERELVRRQIQQNSAYIAEYRSKMEPRLAELHSKLLAYSKLHTNFTPIFVKYFGATNAAAGANAPATLPAPETELAVPPSPQ